jgi:hypothetical protein
MGKFASKRVADLRQNEDNPRTIDKAAFKKLKQSLRDFPEMLEARPVVVNPDNVVLGGNMRLKAAQELKLEKIPVYVATWEEAKQREFIVKDNVAFGSWDFDILANEWDAAELDEWGLDVWQDNDEDAPTAEDVTPEADDFSGRWFLSFEVDDESQANEWFEKLTQEGLTVKIVQ